MGHRTLLMGNKAEQWPEEKATGHSLYMVNGTMSYLHPAPLGRWLGPKVQKYDGMLTPWPAAAEPWVQHTDDVERDVNGDETGAFQRYATGVFSEQSVFAHNPEFPETILQREHHPYIPLSHIDEDFPFACQPGYYREEDYYYAQDGPQCQAICPAGSYCPPATVTPFPCFNASYCPEGSAWPTACPPGSWTQRNDLTAASDCSPCPKGYECALNTTFPVMCEKGYHAPNESMAECIACPIGYYQDTLGQPNCTQCIDGVYCSVASTIRPCDPGEYRNLTDGKCYEARVGHYASLGATGDTPCPPGTYTGVTKTPQCLPCPAGTYGPDEGNEVCPPCPVGGYCIEGATQKTTCVPGKIREEVGGASEADCVPTHPGTYALTGLPELCPRNTYRVERGATNAGDCTPCPAYSLTGSIDPTSVPPDVLRNQSGVQIEAQGLTNVFPPIGAEGKTSFDQCFCVMDFVRVNDTLSNGSNPFTCQCPEGLEFRDSDTAVGYACLPCPMGQFKEKVENQKCTACGQGGVGWTTMEEGTKYRDECVCMEEYFLATPSCGGKEQGFQNNQDTQAFPAMNIDTGVIDATTGAELVRQNFCRRWHCDRDLQQDATTNDPYNLTNFRSLCNGYDEVQLDDAQMWKTYEGGVNDPPECIQQPKNRNCKPPNSEPFPRDSHVWKVCRRCLTLHAEGEDSGTACGGFKGNELETVPVRQTYHRASTSVRVVSPCIDFPHACLGDPHGWGIAGAHRGTCSNTVHYHLAEH